MIWGMNYAVLRRVRRRVNDHTVRAMVDCADHGHGCDHARAISSAFRLIEFIEKLVDDEALVAHSAGYSEGVRYQMSIVEKEANP